MIFNGHGHPREFDNVLVRNGELEAVILVHIDCVYRLARLGIIAVDHLDGLAAKVLAQNGVFAGGERRFVHVELIRVYSALHDSLAESPG